MIIILITIIQIINGDHQISKQDWRTFQCYYLENCKGFMHVEIPEIFSIS